MAMDKAIGSLVLFALGIGQIDALMCWSCSSDLDIRCHDHFNTTNFDRFYQRNYQGSNYQGQIGGGYNQNYPQNNQGRNDYNQGYNQGYQVQSNPYQSRPTNPVPKTCAFSTYGDKKTVCMKKVTTSNDRRTLTIRDCATIPMSQSTGKCPSESNSYIQVEFCEYCDTDGCNSGSSIQVNLAIASISFIALFCLRQ